MTGYDCGVDWARVMFGYRARHVAGRITLMGMGPVGIDQKQLYVVVGYMVGNAAHSQIDPCGMQVIVGDMVIRPHAEATGRNYVGQGAAALLTSSALDPTSWDVQLPPEDAA